MDEKRFHNSGGPNRIPNEIGELLEQGIEPTTKHVPNFSLDDMIMYIINFLEDISTPYEYRKDIARECAYALGEWFWTIFYVAEFERQ
jgi:hypothetical protein